MKDTVVLFFLLTRLKRILPGKDFRIIIENVFTYGKCSLCPTFENRPKIEVRIFGVNIERVGLRFYPHIVCREKYDKKHSFRVCWDCEKWYKKYGKEKYGSIMKLVSERQFFLSEN